MDLGALSVLNSSNDLLNFSTVCLWPRQQCYLIFLGLFFVVDASQAEQNSFSAVVSEHVEYHGTCGS